MSPGQGSGQGNDRFAGRFDGATRWPNLSQEQQDEIGAVALELALTARALDSAGADPASARPFERAFDELLNRLDGIAHFYRLFDFGEPYPVPSILGQVCRRCGCSENDACPERCEWVEDDLCSACAEPGRGGAA